MIKLEHITTDQIVFTSDISSIDATNIKMFLIRNNIEDYQALKDYLDSGKKVYGRDFLKSKLEQVEEQMKKDNDLGIEPQIFITNGYQGVDKKSVIKTETKNKAGVLLFKSPAVCHSSKKSKITNLSVHSVKHLLSHVTPNGGSNALLSTLNEPELVTGEQLLLSLNFFEEQISRQASLNKEPNQNLFIIDSLEKRNIVEQNISDAIKFFINNSKTCIWGELSYAQKRVLTEILLGYNSDKHLTIRKRMIDVISNYTTFDEIQDGVKEKTLERFIKIK
jgi:hypothetical protein